MKQKNLITCPHCHSQSGVYIRLDSVQYFEANGEPGVVSEPLEHGQMCYCNHCGESVCRISTLERIQKENGI